MGQSDTPYKGHRQMLAFFIVADVIALRDEFAPSGSAGVG